jgi:putative peptidoglycan lipid II flippase
MEVSEEELSKTNRKIKANILTVSGATGLGVVVGLVFEIIAVGKVGLSGSGDAYFIAYSLPPFFLALTANAQVVFTTAFAKQSSAATNDHDLFSLTNCSLTFCGLLAVLATILVVLFARPIILMLSPGSESAVQEEAEVILRILAWLPALTLPGCVGSALLASHEKFLVSSTQNLTRYSVATLFVIANPWSLSAANCLASGLVLGVLVQVVVVFVACYFQMGYAPRIRLGFSDPKIRSILQTLVVVSPSVVIRYLPTYAQRVIGSFLPQGSIAAIAIASRFQGPATTVFLGSITTATLPRLSSLLAHRNSPAIRDLIGMTWHRLNLVSIPLVALLVSLNTPLLRLLFERGRVGSQDIILIAPIAIAFNLGLLFRGHLSLSSEYFIAANKRRTVLFIYAAITVLELLFQFLFVLIFGLVGIGIAFSLSLTIVAFFSNRKIGSEHQLSFVGAMTKDWYPLAVGAIIGVLAYFTYQVVSASFPGPSIPSEFARLTGICFVAFVAYYVICVFFKKQPADACVAEQSQ